MNRIIYYIGILAASTLCAQTADAQTLGPDTHTEPTVITLEDCIETGLLNNYDIRIMRNRQQITANNTTRGNAGQLPSLDLSASHSGSSYNSHYVYTDGSTSQSASLNNSLNTGLDFSWTLFEGFSLQANYQRLQELNIQGELEMRLTLEDFVASVSEEYYTLIRQRVRLDNLLQTVTLSRERLRIVQESFQIGASSGLDYQQARVDFNADTSDYLAQTEVVRQCEINLNQLLALDQVERHVVPADTAIFPNAALEKAQLWDNTLQNNTSLLQAISNQTLTEIDLKRVQSRNYPYLRLNGGYGYRRYWYSNGTYDHYHQLGPTFGASAGITLFDGNNRRREQRNARLDIENAQLQRDQMENTLKANMASLWMAYDNNLILWEIEKSNVGVAQSNFSIAMERYRLHELSGIELREAQLSLLQSEERLSTVEYNIKICEISLLMLSGDILNSAR